MMLRFVCDVLYEYSKDYWSHFLLRPQICTNFVCRGLLSKTESARLYVIRQLSMVWEDLHECLCLF